MAVDYWQTYHYDGSFRDYLRHQLTEEDMTNRYITLPENIMNVSRVLDLTSIINSASSLFNVRYQIHLNELFNISQSSLVPYYTAMQHISLLEEFFVGKPQMRFNRHKNKLFLDIDWDRVRAGQFVVVDAHVAVEPDQWSDAWSDWWLQRYATAQMKKTWGEILSKFGGIQLPGSVQINGERILSEATTEINDLEARMITDFSVPPSDYVG